MNIFGTSRAHTVVTIVFFIMVTSSMAIQPAPDLPGPYCGARSPKYRCCEGRSDSCSVPILGTLCYCDKFCKNTTNDDCCPDYDVVCAGGKPEESSRKTSCSLDGHVYAAGKVFWQNCNNCKCTDTGDIFCDQILCVTDTHLLRRLRGMSPILDWHPANHSQFWGRRYSPTLASIANTKNTYFQSNGDMKRARQHAKYLAQLKNTPKCQLEFFDARYAWPGLISPIANQNWCNTAWAHSTVSTASDRLRIQSNSTSINLSVNEMIDCSRSRQNGCWGSGQIDRAWNFLRKKGLHSTRHYHRGSDVCFNSTNKFRRYKSGPMYLVVGEANIQREIMESGPVQATMRVHRDFFSYGRGIYRRSDDMVESERVGFLAVKIIGWGVERGVKYWTAANSWGTDWGEDGYFRIRRGANECGIEDNIFAAWGTPVKFPSDRQETPNFSNELPILKIIAGPSGRRRSNY